MLVNGLSYLLNLALPSIEDELPVKSQAASLADSAQAAGLAVAAVVVVAVAFVRNSVIVVDSDLGQINFRPAAAEVVADCYQIHHHRIAHLLEISARACCHRTSHCFAAEAAAECFVQITLYFAIGHFRHRFHHPVAVAAYSAQAHQADHRFAVEAVVVYFAPKILYLAIVCCQIVHHFVEAEGFHQTSFGSVAAECCQRGWTYLSELEVLTSHRMLGLV